MRHTWADIWVAISTERARRMTEVSESIRHRNRLMYDARVYRALVFVIVCGLLQAERVSLPGLLEPVEVLRDRWGIPHIYARNTHDLFFAQGYVAALDRLWQIDLWRRTGTGKLAEVLGPSALGRDRIARAVQYRGDWD